MLIYYINPEVPSLKAYVHSNHRDIAPKIMHPESIQLYCQSTSYFSSARLKLHQVKKSLKSFFFSKDLSLSGAFKLDEFLRTHHHNELDKYLTKFSGFQMLRGSK